MLKCYERCKVLPDNFESDVKNVKVEWISSQLFFFDDGNKKDAYY